MKKKVAVLLLGVLSLSTVTVFGATSKTVYGNYGGNSWSGYVSGSKNSSNCYAAATTNRQANQGSSQLMAYVEIVNSQGYRIGNGAEGKGTNQAYSGTITRAGGNNAHGSHGLTGSSSTRSFSVLY